MSPRRSRENEREQVPDPRRRARQTQRRLLRESRAARLPLAATVAVGMVTVGLIIAQAALLARVIAAVFMDGQGLDEVAPDLIALGAVSVGRGLADAAFETSGRIGASRVMGELRRRLADHLIHHAPGSAPADGVRRDGSGGSAELVAAAIDGVDSLEAWFARYLPQVVLSVLAPLAILAWVIPLDWPAALILLITAPLIPIFMVLIGLATEHRSRRRWRMMARLSAHFLDRVSGLETLRINGLAGMQTKAIARVGDRYRRETIATLRIGFLSALVLELLAMLGTAVVAATVGIQLAGGHLQLEAGLCVLLLAPELYMPLRRLGAEFHAGADGMVAAERIFEALSRGDLAPNEKAPAFRGSDAGIPDRTAIQIRDVGFGYPGREPVLEGVNLNIEHNETVALVGASGSGKSTLLALILGLLLPQQGSILARSDERGDHPDGLLDIGVAVRRRNLAAWHRQVAWVPQRSLLIAGTLAENVRLTAPEASDSQVAAAIAAAGLDPVVAELPAGPATVIGEGGRRLSSGQRRRIALARAFLRDAPIVVLDEPTAHLDRETARSVAAAIEQLTADRTAVIASHRIEAIAMADRAVKLEGGRLLPLEDHQKQDRSPLPRLVEVPA